MKLSWSLGQNAATVATNNITLYRKAGELGSYIPVSIQTDGVSYSDTGLTPDTQYYYKVDMQGNNGTKCTSTELAVKTAMDPSYFAVSKVTFINDLVTLQIDGGSCPTKTYQVTANGSNVGQSGAMVIEPVWINAVENKVTIKVLDPTVPLDVSIKGKTPEGVVTEPVVINNVQNYAVAIGAIENLRGRSHTDSIYLEWDPIANADYYEIEKNGQIMSVQNITVPGYEITGLAADTMVSFRVRAVKENVLGAWSSMVGVRTLKLVPQAVNTSTLVETKGNHWLQYSWSAAVNATEYEVEFDGEVLPRIKGTLWKQEGLPQNSAHTFRVRGVNGDGTGEWIPLMVVRTANNLPVVLQNLKVDADDQRISLIWDLADDAESYRVVLKEKKNNTITTTKEQITTNPYIDFSGLMADCTYDFTVNGVNPAGNGPQTNVENQQMYALPTPAIEWVDAENADLMIQWGEVKGAYKYEIQQDGTTIGESVERLYKIDFTDAENHQYRVRGKDTDGGYSNWSEPIESKKIPRRPGWVDRVITGVESDKVSLSWDSVAPRTEEAADAVKGYDVEVDGFVVQVTDTKYLHDELDPFTEHKYRVRVVTDYRDGFWTDYIKVKTPAGILPKIYDTQMANKSHTAIMTWDPIPGAEWYEVDVNGTVIKGYSATRYEHHGVKSFEENTYRVRACNRYGKGPWSHLMINCAIPAQVKKKEPLEMALTASDITDFKKYRLEVYYPSSVRVEDLCAYSVEKEVSDGMVPGTEIEILNHSPGRAEFLVHKVVDEGYSWAGIINNIVFKGRQTGGATLTYTVHDIEGDNPPAKEHDLKLLEKENFEKANPYAVEDWHN